MRKGICGIFIYIIIINASGFSHPPLILDESSKECVIRIESPAYINDSIQRGTGILIKDLDNKQYILTNNHVLRSIITAAYFDSVFIRKNIKSLNGRISASGEKAVVYLKADDRDVFMAYSDSNVDLALIPCTVWKGRNRYYDNSAPRFSAIASNIANFLNREQMDSLGIVEGRDVQTYGYSYSVAQQSQFIISRFGKISIFTRDKFSLRWPISRTSPSKYRVLCSEWILLDLISRGGDSGGPVFLLEWDSDKAYIIGIIQGGGDANEITLAIPSYFILDLVNEAKKRFR